MAPTIQVPTVGQANSTEAVKVTNSLTNLAAYFAAGIPASDVAATSGVAVQSWRTVSSNASAAARDLINSNAAGITITLPAPATNALVGIWNSGGTAASPTVVSGTNIYGVGLSAASSFKLGLLGAFTILQSDGSSWLITAGQQDTGWVALSPQTHWSAAAGYYSPAIRLRGDTIEFCGRLTGDGTNFSPLATLASAYRPAATVTPVGATGFTVVTAGTFTTLTSTDCLLDGARYRLI